MIPFSDKEKLFKWDSVASCAFFLFPVRFLKPSLGNFALILLSNCTASAMIVCTHAISIVTVCMSVAVLYGVLIYTYQLMTV